MSKYPSVLYVSMLAVLAFGLLFITAGCGGGGGGSVVTPLSLTNATVTPTTLGSPSGGNVTISAVVTSTSTITDVHATVTKPGGATDTVTMSPSGSTYSDSSYRAEGNDSSDNQPQTYSVVISATDSAGNTANSGTLTFQVPPFDLPPPPPPSAD